jgi:hypothetical protein
MDGLVFLTGFTVVGVVICALILWGTRGELNEWPAVGRRAGVGPDARSSRPGS